MKEKNTINEFLWKTIIVVLGATIFLVVTEIGAIPADKVRLWAGLPICHSN